MWDGAGEVDPESVAAADAVGLSAVATPVELVGAEPVGPAGPHAPSDPRASAARVTPIGPRREAIAELITMGESWPELSGSASGHEPPFTRPATGR